MVPNRRVVVEEVAKQFSWEQYMTEENAIFACKRALLALFIYLIGYCNGSIVTLMFVVCLWMTYDKLYEHKRLLEARKPVGEMPTEKEMISQVFGKEQLPAWVRFPDVQRCDWLNQIIAKFWPKITPNLSKTIEDGLEEILRDLSLSVKQFWLGSRPPKIDGIKIYNENTRQDQLIIDVDLVYLGDCHAVIGTSFFDVNIKDFQLKGRIRLGLKPLLHRSPFAGVLEICFVEMPVLDFETVSGGLPILEVFNIKSLPNTMLRKIISDYLVFPKKLRIPLSEEAVAGLQDSDYFGSAEEDEMCLDDFLKNLHDLDRTRRMHRF